MRRTLPALPNDSNIPTTPTYQRPHPNFHVTLRTSHVIHVRKQRKIKKAEYKKKQEEASLEREKTASTKGHHPLDGPGDDDNLSIMSVASSPVVGTDGKGQCMKYFQIFTSCILSKSSSQVDTEVPVEGP